MSWPPPPEIVTIYTIYAVTLGFALLELAHDRARARRRNILERLEHLERKALDDRPPAR